MDRDPTASEKNRGQGVDAPQPHNPTAGHDSILPKKPAQSTIFEIDGVSLAHDACNAHLADPSAAKSAFIAECRAALLSELASGPTSMAHARFARGICAPVGVDGRAAGAAALELYRAGLIEAAGWHVSSPWKNCHAATSRMWRIPSRGGRP
jgi:hypothetical protein